MPDKNRQFFAGSLFRYDVFNCYKFLDQRENFTDFVNGLQVPLLQSFTAEAKFVKLLLQWQPVKNVLSSTVRNSCEVNKWSKKKPYWRTKRNKGYLWWRTRRNKVYLWYLNPKLLHIVIVAPMRLSCGLALSFIKVTEPKRLKSSHFILLVNLRRRLRPWKCWLKCAELIQH